MKRRIIFGLLLVCFFGVPLVFAQSTTDPIRNNQFFLESVRLINLAHASFDEGDYDAAKKYADDALYYSQLSDEYVASVLGGGAVTVAVTTPVPASGSYALPAQYTVGTWATTKDCFWNIAALASVYNDPWQWRTLYNANRARLPDPNNPDLIHPGTVLTIPSIRGETRDGMYVAGRTYVALPR
jgi:nucleoid-associated protein YgaU